MLSVAQDHLRNILGKSENQTYKPWKNNFAPKNPHSPFGDFPPEYMPKTKLVEQKREPNFEVSHSGSSLNKYERQRGSGGMTSSTLEKKPKF